MPTLTKNNDILDTLKFRHPVLCVLRHEHFDIWSIILRVRLQQYYKNSKYLRRELSWTMVGVWPVGIYRMSQNCSVSPSPTHQTYPLTPNLLHLKFDLQTSMRGQNGVEFYQESTGHVRFFLALLLANQWEAENPNFLVIWSTDKCEGSKWGRILPGIHWACPLIGQWEAEFCQKSNDHGPRHVSHLLLHL